MFLIFSKSFKAFLSVGQSVCLSVCPTFAKSSDAQDIGLTTILVAFDKKSYKPTKFTVKMMKKFDFVLYFGRSLYSRFWTKSIKIHELLKDLSDETNRVLLAFTNKKL